MVEILQTTISYLVPVVEGFGALVIVIDAVRGMAQYVLTILGRSTQELAGLRLRLGRSLVLGLEFQVAADILKTAISPTWNDILLLAALIVLRTVLNFFLDLELAALTRSGRPVDDGRL